MDSKDQDISNDMARVLGLRGDNGVSFPVMSGTVISVESDSSCTVKLTGGDDDTPLDGVTMSVLLNNTAGFYGVPSKGAFCLVAAVDGEGGWELLKASKYDKVMMNGATLIQLNDGSLGGLLILQKVLDNLNAIKNYLTTMKSAIAAGITGVGIGSAANGTTGASDFNTAMMGAEITFEDMENTKITQG